MSDHLHLFCAPRHPNIVLNQWVKYWKSRFKKNHFRGHRCWHPQDRDTRLRRYENYQEKWEYIRWNLVRKGWVTHPNDWPYQGVAERAAMVILTLIWEGEAPAEPW